MAGLPSDAGPAHCGLGPDPRGLRCAREGSRRNISQVGGPQLALWKHYKQYVATEIDVTGVLPGVKKS